MKTVYIKPYVYSVKRAVLCYVYMQPRPETQQWRTRKVLASLDEHRTSSQVLESLSVSSLFRSISDFCIHPVTTTRAIVIITPTTTCRTVRQRAASSTPPAACATTIKQKNVRRIRIWHLDILCDQDSRKIVTRLTNIAWLWVQWLTT